MGATISTTTTITTTLRHIPTTNVTQTRTFARYVPYKPSPKPKLHKNLLTIKTLRAHLEKSYLVSPLPCHGFSANKFKPLKTPLPADPSAAKIVVVKNTLAAKALAGTQWHKLGPIIKGMNSLMFVKKEDVVGECLGGVRGKVKDVKMEFNEFTGALVHGELYGHLDLKVLETSPSRSEAHALLLGSVFGPSGTLMAILEGFGCGDDAGDAGSKAEKSNEGVEQGAAAAS